MKNPAAVLAHALSQCRSDVEIQALLRDLMTSAELEEIANRLDIARTLWTTDNTYLEIAAEFKTSTTTVTRVADWLYKKPYGGYRTILNRLYPKK